MTTGVTYLEEPPRPVRFTTKAEAVYREVRGRILSGMLRPAAPLNQDALAVELAVSVTPVREAVRRLEAEGLVRLQAHKTVIVAPLSRNELREIYEVRLQLDPHAAFLATRRASDEEIAEVERLARAPVSDDASEQVRLNRAFHREIYSLCGNALLIQILDRLWERTDRYRLLLASGDAVLFAAAPEHLEIANAMRTRRPPSVRQLVRIHIEKAQSMIENALR